MQPTENTLGQAQRLALERGAAVRKEPFAPWPDLAADEIEAVAAVNAGLRPNRPLPQRGPRTPAGTPRETGPTRVQ